MNTLFEKRLGRKGGIQLKFGAFFDKTAGFLQESTVKRETERERMRMRKKQ